MLIRILIAFYTKITRYNCFLLFVYNFAYEQTKNSMKVVA
jgi:hypothetical protein